jgi:sporulation protein YtfJ
VAIEEIIHTVLSELRTIAKTETVIGEPIEAAGTTIIPVSKVSLGFGAGSGTAREREGGGGGGSGGGASVEPIAFLVVRDGRVDVLTLREKPGLTDVLIDEVPDVIRKVRDFAQRRRKGESKRSEANNPDEAQGAPSKPGAESGAS